MQQDARLNSSVEPTRRPSAAEFTTAMVQDLTRSGILYRNFSVYHLFLLLRSAH